VLSFLRAYKKNDPSVKTYLEVLVLLPGPKAILFHRIGHFFYKIGLYFLARLISEVSRFITGIEIHPGAQIGRNLVIDHGMGVVIGETAVVGSDCLIYHGVTLGGVEADASGRRHPKLGNRITVGAGAKILGAITLKDGVKVGAGAVVITDCSEGVTMVGMPAKPKG